MILPNGEVERVHVHRGIELDASAARNAAGRKREVGRDLSGARGGRVPMRSDVWIGESERVLDLALSHFLDGDEPGDERKTARPRARRSPPSRVAGLERPHAGSGQVRGRRHRALHPPLFDASHIPHSVFDCLSMMQRCRSVPAAGEAPGRNRNHRAPLPARSESVACHDGDRHLLARRRRRREVNGDAVLLDVDPERRRRRLLATRSATSAAEFRIYCR